VTLADLSTTTSVTFDPRLTKDSLELNGVESEGTPLARAVELVGRVRAENGSKIYARIVSKNDFPTASGLASSASGFAALALAAVRAGGLDWSADRVADLARRSSASAARSVFGGFVELDGETARAVAPKSTLGLRVLVCVTTEAQKTTSSTDGMKRTAETSPYYGAWLDSAPRIHAALREALLANDFAKVGELAESSALAMHASAMAAGVVYVSGVTLAALAEVRAIREGGLLAYATIDAGPHLKCLVQEADAAQVKERLARVPGVLRIIDASPGDGARILDPSVDGGRA
jgi:diphosphomevalonate decarboxylase